MSDLDSLLLRAQDVLDRAGFRCYIVDVWEHDGSPESGPTIRLDVWEDAL